MSSRLHADQHPKQNQYTHIDNHITISKTYITINKLLLYLNLDFIANFTELL